MCGAGCAVRGVRDEACGMRVWGMRHEGRDVATSVVRHDARRASALACVRRCLGGRVALLRGLAHA
eukprot:2073224-Prymnesium_polylepis.1